MCHLYRILIFLDETVCRVINFVKHYHHEIR